MKVTLESTDQLVEVNGITARVWEGHTASGIPVTAIIPRITCPEGADARQFEAELRECVPPRPDGPFPAGPIPLRLIL